MTIDPPLTTIGLVLFAGLIAMLVAGFVFAAAAKRGAAAIVFVGGVVMAALFYFGFSPLQPIKSAFVDMIIAERLSNQSPIAAPVAPRTPTAEVVSDEELAAVASAQPKIELDSEIEIGDKAADAKSDRPDWIDAHLGDDQKLIVAGPYAYDRACEIETDQELRKWIVEKFITEEVTSDAMNAASVLTLKNYKKEQYQEVRETSVGEFYILYTLAEVSPKSATEIAEIAKSMATQAAKTARMKGAQFVTFAGAGVLSLVALAHVVLKSGGRKAKNGDK